MNAERTRHQDDDGPLTPSICRRIAEEPLDGQLDRFTWRAAWLVAASLIERPGGDA